MQYMDQAVFVLSLSKDIVELLDPGVEIIGSFDP
jgi:hypothetical protein